MQAVGDIGGIKGVEERGEWKAADLEICMRAKMHAHPCAHTHTHSHTVEKISIIASSCQALRGEKRLKNNHGSGEGRSRVRSIGLDHRIRKGKSDPGRRGGEEGGGGGGKNTVEGKGEKAKSKWHLCCCCCCCESGCGRVPTWVQDASGRVGNAPGYRSGAFRASLINVWMALHCLLRATRPTSVCLLSGTDPRVDARCTRYVWMVLPGGAPGPTYYMLYPQGIILDT
ncbi:uncharacterized protein BO88DRAFT_425378 [Aspergillus vadensis CBS 113365]|uniref:Uncharacterized protein n=1 Tax=Aspergillus vadensis (strain CBS 113365 / IMI 142717 / IBT 24658) TaxID=1448311 RepID=A0A319BV50_ASPVC|nr:hypothetical protein BO88DRAFT_425378 [Aspergillus vadensis CBS 113365]PYH69713.1 hypothetical protein BO88DRAFT_425378 [Aspergillus vadensis CBS 113365]